MAGALHPLHQAKLGSHLWQAHYIRCVKPNSDRSATSFDAKLTLEQLKYSGVFEAVTIRKCGYPFRLPNLQFLNRYRCILSKEQRAEIDAAKNTREPSRPLLLLRLHTRPRGGSVTCVLLRPVGLQS